jgi:hypothetical protein
VGLARPFPHPRQLVKDLQPAPPDGLVHRMKSAMHEKMTDLNSSLGVRRSRGPYRMTQNCEIVRLEGFEPPTLGSVGTFHNRQLGDFVENLA